MAASAVVLKYLRTLWLLLWVIEYCLNRNTFQSIFKVFSKPNDPVAQLRRDTFGAISSDLAALCWPAQV